MTGNPDPMAAAARGLAVFPLPPGERYVPGWPGLWSSSDPAVIQERWRPGDNVGVSCRASWVVGLDLDQHDGGPDGVAGFGRLCTAIDGGWPATLTIRSPHGLHLYFRAPVDRVTVSSIGRVAPGVDVRAPGERFGGYLIGPTSLVDGRAYTIEVDVAIAAAPRWLADLCTRRPPNFQRKLTPPGQGSKFRADPLERPA